MYAHLKRNESRLKYKNMIDKYNWLRLNGVPILLKALNVKCAKPARAPHIRRYRKLSKHLLPDAAKVIFKMLIALVNQIVIHHAKKANALSLGNVNVMTVGAVTHVRSNVHLVLGDHNAAINVIANTPNSAIL